MKDAFAMLDERKLIFAGSIIEAEVLEDIFVIKKEDKDFIWKKFSLKEVIKLQGYFTTERGCPEGSFRILKSEEMADYADAKLAKNKNSNEKIALILKAHDISSLNEEEKKRHKFVQMKAAKCAARMQEELLMDDVI